MGVRVLAGTRKGLFLLESDKGRREWELAGPFLAGWSIFHAVVDPRDGTIHVASNNEVYGATTHRSTDRGATWTRFGSGMPLVEVTDLYVSSDSTLVRAATFGRGFWELAP